jgi:hypothetical protein
LKFDKVDGDEAYYAVIFGVPNAETDAFDTDWSTYGTI